MEYKGYAATVEYDEEAKVFHGEVVNTRAVITFQGTSVSALEREFAKSVEVYLAWCQERGKEPEKPYSGHLTLRVPPEIHRAAAVAAARAHKSLNAWIADQIVHATTA